MQSDDPLDFVVPEPHVRAAQVLAGALAMGVVTFLLAVVFMAAQAEPKQPDAEQVQLIVILSAAHAFVALSSGSLAAMAPTLFLSPARLRAALGERPAGDAVVAQGLPMVRTTMILRLALLEGPALFGLAVCFIAVTSGVAAEHPLVWLNVLSSFAMLGAVAVTFPTEGRLRRTLTEAVLRMQSAA